MLCFRNIFSITKHIDIQCIYILIICIPALQIQQLADTKRRKSTTLLLNCKINKGYLELRVDEPLARSRVISLRPGLRDDADIFLKSSVAPSVAPVVCYGYKPATDPRFYARLRMVTRLYADINCATFDACQIHHEYYI